MRDTTYAAGAPIHDRHQADLKRKGLNEEALAHNTIAAGFQGQRAWTDHFPNGDFMETILTSSFDWNGIREPFVVATENDAMKPFWEITPKEAGACLDATSWRPADLGYIAYTYRYDNI